MLASGARLLQIRNKEHWAREVFDEARCVAELCAKHGAELIVNDRADFAMLLGAGLHVGQDDLAPADARGLIGTGRTLGFSTHHLEQLRAGAKEPVDYVALGPIFGTSNKENPDPVVGLEKLAEWRGLTSKPLVAIGGITRESARAVLDAGADSLAVIGDLLPETCDAVSIARRFEEWMRIAHG